MQPAPAPFTTDFAILGRGLIGTAAAAHAAQSGRQVLLIGPSEPAEGQDALVYASHYDEARIQRLIGKDPVWTRLNHESSQAYPLLEAETGIRFHEPVGCLYVSPHGVDEYLGSAEASRADFPLAYRRLSGTEALSQAVPDYRFPEGSEGLLEFGQAGMIRPRRLQAAQQARFEARGGRVLDETVVRRETLPAGHRLHLASGAVVEAGRVLVAAGAFANFHGLLPQKLDITLKGETVLLAEVTEADAERLATLPALLYERFTPELDGIYLTAPLRYPDGKPCIKLGLNLAEDLYFDTLAQVQAWFRDTAHSDALLTRVRQALEAILPGIAFRSFAMKHCLIHRTPTLRQYIGEGGAPGLYVVAGCNGYSAMCSEALGRLAAHWLTEGKMEAGWEAELFAPRWKPCSMGL